MKSILTIFALVAFTLEFGTAYADDIPYRTGTTLALDENFYMKDVYGDALCVKDFGAPGPPSAKIDAAGIGTFAYNDVIFSHEPKMLARNAKGSAAGGVCPETVFRDNAKTRIWDNLMGAPGGSDLP